MNKYVALLRGINVGGNKKVPMAELKQVLEKNKFMEVKTLLASGNVIFAAENNQLKDFQKIIEQHFGFSINTIILPLEKIKQIVKTNPFKNIKVTKDIRLNLTFITANNSKLKIPYQSADKSFKIIKLADNVVYSVLDLAKTKTIKFMAILEKEFGKNITTRSYNTVKKIAEIN